jgi:hypothetical protein
VTYTAQTWTDGSGGGTPVSAARLGVMETGISDAHSIGQASGLLLDLFAGASDDAKLTTALAYVAAQAYPPPILLGPRNYSFSTGARTPFDGLRIQGAEGYGNPERNSGQKVATRVSLSMSGGWFTMTGSTSIFGVSFSRIAFTGGNNARVLDQGTSSAVWYCLQMRDIYSSGLRNVLGSYSTKLLTTAIQLDGSWEINNCYDTAFHVGGSDCVALWPQGMLLDSGTAFNTAGASTGHPHLWLDFQEKSTLGPIYMTTEGAWGGILQTGQTANTTGSNQGGRIVYNGGVWEGRNSGAPCNGSIFRLNGGLATLRDVTVNYGMASAASQSHSPTDAGIIHVYGTGRLLADGLTYDRATSVAESVPLVYIASGAKARVFNTETLSKSVTWTGLPRVDDQNTSNTGITTDDTMTVV